MASIFEQLGIDPQLIVVNIIGFILLLWLLKKFLFKPVTDILDSRQEDIRSTYAAADQDRASAAELRADYEARLAKIEDEAREKIQAAVKEGQSHKEGLLSDAREESERIIRRGNEELEREQVKVMTQLREEVVDLAISSAQKLIESSLDDTKHRTLIKQFIDGIEVRK